MPQWHADFKAMGSNFNADSRKRNSHVAVSKSRPISTTTYYLSRQTSHKRDRHRNLPIETVTVNMTGINQIKAKNVFESGEISE